MKIQNLPLCGIPRQQYFNRCGTKSKTQTMFIIIGMAIILLGCAPSGEKPPQTARVARSDLIAQLPTTGVVIPRNRLEIKPPVSGRIEKVLVEEGQKVRKGEVMAWMSSSERAALLDAAREKGAEEVKYWQEVYKPAPIAAPLDGFIIKRNMEQGQTFTENDAVLVMADRLIVQAQIDETDIGRISLKQKGEIILDAYPKNNIPGIVGQIAYESETVNNVTVYKVDVQPESVPPFFKSGMSATINFMLNKKENVLSLPAAAIKRKGGHSYAFIRQDGKISAVLVRTGMENNDSVEIIAGLEEGREVIIPTPKIIKETIDSTNIRTPFNFLGGSRRR